MSGATEADAVHFRDGVWWFWDECWADEYGPYDTEKAAREACVEYGKQLNGEKS